MNEKQIMYDSPEAAEYKEVTLKGWFSNGKFYGEQEHWARHDGCTHKKCSCGNIIEKVRVKCDSCWIKEINQVFHSYPEVEWDGKSPLALFDNDIYFFDEDELFDYCYEHNVQPQSLQLVLCKKEYAHHIEIDEWIDSLPEHGEAPDWLKEAIDEFNKKIDKQEPLSYFPDKIRAKVNITFNLSEE